MVTWGTLAERECHRGGSDFVLSTTVANSSDRKITILMFPRISMLIFPHQHVRAEDYIRIQTQDHRLILTEKGYREGPCRSVYPLLVSLWQLNDGDNILDVRAPPRMPHQQLVRQNLSLLSSRLRH